jgi:hypothetical protein
MIGDRTFSPPHALIRALTLLVAVGGVAALAGLLLEPQRTAATLLLASFALVGLSLFGAVFLALLQVTGADWAAALRRVPEAMAAAFPAGALLLLGVLLARPELYPWCATGAVETENATPLKQIWLYQPFFLLRSVLYLACWYGFILALLRYVGRPDTDGNASHTRATGRLSAAFLVVFSVTFWLASQDWIISLESEWLGDGTRRPSNWSSTIFGLYNFSGLFLGGLAVLTLLVLWLRRVSFLGRVVGADQLHDLGKLLFAFSIIWMYMWFCQYMLIWYVNNPEETTYFVLRLQGAWQPLLVLNMFLNWVVPFLVLLPRAAKRSTSVLTKVSLVVVAGRCLDLYLMILPAVEGATPINALWEVGLLCSASGLFCLVVFHALGKVPIVPEFNPVFADVPPVVRTAQGENGRPTRMTHRSGLS